jgi:hypothetical protein
MKLKVEPFHAYDLVMFLFVLINQAKYYAQDSILGRLICLPDCDKTSEKRKRKSVVFGINVYLNKF